MADLELFGASRIDRKEEKITYTWAVSNLNLLQEAKLISIESPKFSINNKEWYLHLELNLSEPYCLNLLLCKSSSNNSTEYKYSFSVLNEKNEKSINSAVFGQSTLYWRIHRYQLYDDLSNYSIIPGDTLKIVCEVKFVTYPQTKFENLIAEDLEAISLNINKNKNNHLFLEEQFSDVKLVTACGKVLKAHKCIVAADSPAFAAMFKHDMIENKSNTVNIPDVDHEVLKEMLRFIYMGEVEDIKKMASELFIVADKYDIQGLKSKCEKYIADNIAIENVMQIFELAVKYNAKQLKTRAMQFMKSNVADMMKMDTFKEKMQVTATGSYSDLFTFLIQ